MNDLAEFESTAGEVLFNEIQAGRYLGGKASPVSPRTLQRWRMEGSGPCFVRIGRLVRYRRNDLDDWLSLQVRRSTSEPQQ
jgi:hypothetical protein